MPKFVIERELPGAGKLSPAELHAISQKSCAVLREMGPRIQWDHSYVTDDKVYCVYIADSEAAVRRHAELGGFPANRVSRVHAVIDPTTADWARRSSMRDAAPKFHPQVVGHGMVPADDAFFRPRCPTAPTAASRR